MKIASYTIKRRYKPKANSSQQRPLLYTPFNNRVVALIRNPKTPFLNHNPSNNTDKVKIGKKKKNNVKHNLRRIELPVLGIPPRPAGPAPRRPTAAQRHRNRDAGVLRAEPRPRRRRLRPVVRDPGQRDGPRLAGLRPAVHGQVVDASWHRDAERGWGAPPPRRCCRRCCYCVGFFGGFGFVGKEREREGDGVRCEGMGKRV